MEQKEINYKGKGLAYRVMGEGPAIILLHGFGEDSSIWKHQYQIFADHKLIIPDLPGSGGSEMIDDMSMEGLADAVKFLIDAEAPTSLSSGEGRGEVALIGHSMGGYVTLAFAGKYPEWLNGFGLFHSTAYADNEAKKEVRRKGIEFMNKQGGGPFLDTTIPNLYSGKTKSENWSLVEEQLATAHNFSAPALVSYYNAMMNREDRTHVLRSSVPVLFVMGRHDTAVPAEDVLRQCHLPQTAYIHILEDSGHMGMIEEAEETNKILTEFIAGL